MCGAQHKEVPMRKTVIALTVAAIAIVALAGVMRLGQGDQDRDGLAPPEVVQRGKYMVSVMGCNDCHTPWKMGPNGPEPDMERFLSGHPEQIGPLKAVQPGAPWLWSAVPTNTAFTGPWGVSYTANLTPDRNTGLGIWTEEMFIRAIRTGRHMGTSRPINPPMPWPAYRNATDDDLKAVFAFLRTIKPIVNHVPDYQPPAETRSSND
jgi:hypothetical protein